MSNIYDIISAIIVSLIWLYSAYKVHYKLREMEDILFKQKNELDAQTAQYNVLLSFQLSQVMGNAINNEDYELAHKCQDAISKIGQIDEIEITIKNLAKNERNRPTDKQ